MKINDIYENFNAMAGWRRLKILKDLGDGVFEVKFLRPLKFWKKRATGLIKRDKLEKNYSKKV